MTYNGRGYELCGIAWICLYQLRQTLPAGTEHANCSETRIVYEPLLGGSFVLISAINHYCPYVVNINIINPLVIFIMIFQVLL